MSAPSFYWGIASYQRPDRQPMLKLLSGMGYTRDEIILSTQTEEDYTTYLEKYGEMATVLYRKGKNVCDNKNTILDWIAENGGGTRVVICSDKVRAVNWMDRGKHLHKFETREQMDRLVKTAFGVTKMLGGSVFGVYSVGNTFYMSHDISINQQILGCFMGILDPTAEKFDPLQPLKEDYEFSLRHISKGHKVVRFNDICLTETLHTKGGSHALWHSEGDYLNELYTGRLLELYPRLVKPHATRKNEVRYIGPTRKIHRSIMDL